MAGPHPTAPPPTVGGRRPAGDLVLTLVTRPEECLEVARLFDRIWSVQQGTILDRHMMVALVHSQNYVLLASLDGRPVGAAVGFCGPPGRPFHSHIVGVRPEASGHGIGRAIKEHQRRWCLDRGIATMAWTFDPLVARNAHFNIRVLGAFPRHYHEEFYGPMRDAVNAGQASDRMVVRWDLPTGTPSDRARPPAGAPSSTTAHVALSNQQDEPGGLALDVPPGTTDVLVGVPRDIEGLRRDDPDLALRWRRETRLALESLLANGWQVHDFDDDRHYILRREP
ncbi:GNAT family N-acetyltransferase [uncultured Serinicoccus sp.]|uniref:GNAT family N-acetyltransferase n=1 Tax=uncultured Serinicoccus sp. TaxID=735514 RepID=UPI0026217C74|nr:GNAT family N-acetyltransferase [uncultured Serinicoccus sp.]